GARHAWRSRRAPDLRVALARRRWSLGGSCDRQQLRLERGCVRRRGRRRARLRILVLGERGTTSRPRVAGGLGGRRTPLFGVAANDGSALLAAVPPGSPARAAPREVRTTLDRALGGARDGACRRRLLPGPRSETSRGGSSVVRNGGLLRWPLGMAMDARRARLETARGGTRAPD